MVNFNRSGAAFNSILDSGVDYETARHRDAATLRDDDLYYRNQEFPLLKGELQRALEGQTPFSDLSTDAYQAWNETGWKKPHATYEAVERFKEKALEEAQEIDDEIESYFDNKDPTRLTDELGDYLWVVTAVANNGGVVISDALKHRLYEYAVGTKVWDGEKFEFPEWYDTAASLSTKRATTTLGDLSTLFDAGFVPRHSPIMNLYEGEEICLTHFAFDMRTLAVFMTQIGSKQYGYGEGLPTYDSVRDGQADLGVMVAEAYFRVAATAHSIGISMADIIEHNVRKVSNRIATQTVDKTDGLREE